MDTRTQIDAIGKLSKAKTALERCESVIHEPPKFKTEWEFFLVALNGVFSFLEQATKGHTKLAPWFGKIKNKRRTDQLLNYLTQARHAEEHGTRPVVEMERKTTFSNDGGGTLEIQTDKHGRQVYVIRPNAGASHRITRGVPTLVLATVHNSKFGDSFPPPTEHLGEPLQDVSPLAVGKLAIAFYEDVVKEACRLSRP